MLLILDFRFDHFIDHLAQGVHFLGAIDIGISFYGRTEEGFEGGDDFVARVETLAELEGAKVAKTVCEAGEAH